ncbi:MAG: hypothetical protein QNJ51_03015 [Calothrix sp. MO_167.B12]|nr:hypothetical protein [Calothrix sp. MO_167.B12]
MTTSTIISDLQQANRCSNKCNCCKDLQRQINQLKQEIKRIPKVNEKSIIDKASEKAKNIITPLLPGLITPIVGGIVLTQISPLKTAQQALTKDLIFAKNKISGISALVNSNKAKVGKALFQASSAATASKAAVSRVAGIAGILSGLAASVAVLKLSESRFNAAEKVTDRLSTDLTKSFSLIQSNRSRIKSLGNQVGVINKKVENNSSSINSLEIEVNNNVKNILKTSKIAQTAQQESKKAQETAQKAITKSEEAIQNSSRANTTAQNAIAISSNAKNTADNAATIASSAQTMANNANITSNNAFNNSTKALNTANAAQSIATKALNQASDAQDFAGTALNVATNAQNIATNVAISIPTLSSRITNLEKLTSSLKKGLNKNIQNVNKTTIKNTTINNIRRITQNVSADVSKIQSSLDKAKITSSSASISAAVAETKVNRLNKRVNDMDKEFKDLLKKVDKNQNNLVGLITPIAAGVAAIPVGKDFVDKVGEGTCSTLNKSKCTSKFRNDISRDRKLANKNLLNSISAGAGAINSGLNSVILARVNILLARTSSMFDILATDRAFNILNLLTNLHNAAMLSSNVVQTLTATFDAGANLIGINIKDKDGNNISTGGFVGQIFNDALKKLFGATVVENFYQTLSKANRIYQSATNLLDDVQGMFDSARQLGELTANNTGKIGNALKKAGAIYENAFDWMSEKNNAASAKQKKWDAVINGINEVDDKISNFNSIIGTVQSVKDNVEQLKQSKKEFEESLKKSQGSISTEANTNKNLSQLKSNVTDADISKTDG